MFLPVSFKNTEVGSDGWGQLFNFHYVRENSEIVNKALARLLASLFGEQPIDQQIWMRLEIRHRDLFIQLIESESATRRVEDYFHFQEASIMDYYYA